MDGLYLRVIQSGEAHKIETPDRLSFEGSEISWFPNGTHVLFTAREDSAPALWKLAIIGGLPKKLSDSAYSAVITADGSRIAYLPGRLSNEIHLMGPDGENAARLVPLEDDGIWRLGWSPNGKFLLFGTGLMDSQVLRAVDVATSDVHVVMEDTRTFQNWRGFLPFVWTSDDKLIYARRGLAPNNSMSNLWQVPLVSDNAMIDGVPAQLTNITGYNFRDISVSQDNTRVAFLIEQNQLDVYVAETPDGQPRLENTRRLTFDERSDMPGGWADNSTLYFQSRRGASQNIFAQNIFAGDAIAITGALVNSDDAVEISPDGKWILYWEEEVSDASTKNLMRQSVDGGLPGQY
jgi:Tol biopolymer transport system component